MTRVLDEIYFLSKSLQQKKTEYELEGENREQFLTSEELDQILSSSHQLNQIVDIKKQKKKLKNKKRREFDEDYENEFEASSEDDLYEEELLLLEEDLVLPEKDNNMNEEEEIYQKQNISWKKKENEVKKEKKQKLNKLTFEKVPNSFENFDHSIRLITEDLGGTHYPESLQLFHDLFDEGTDNCHFSNLFDKKNNCTNVIIDDILEEANEINEHKEYITPSDAVDLICELGRLSENDSILDPVCGSADFLISVALRVGSSGVCIEPNKKLANLAKLKIKEHKLENRIRVLNTHWRDSEVKALLKEEITVSYVYSLHADTNGLSNLFMNFQQPKTLVVSYLRPLFEEYLFDADLITHVGNSGPLSANTPLHFYVLPKISEKSKEENLKPSGWIDPSPLIV